jgi:hypothetical protein
MIIPILKVKPNEPIDPFTMMAACLIYTEEDGDRDTAKLIKNRFGPNGVVSLSKLREYKKKAFQI